MGGQGHVISTNLNVVISNSKTLHPMRASGLLSLAASCSRRTTNIIFPIKEPSSLSKVDFRYSNSSGVSIIISDNPSYLTPTSMIAKILTPVDNSWRGRKNFKILNMPTGALAQEAALHAKHQCSRNGGNEQEFYNWIWRWWSPTRGDWGQDVGGVGGGGGKGGEWLRGVKGGRAEGGGGADAKGSEAPRKFSHQQVFTCTCYLSTTLDTAWPLCVFCNFKRFIKGIYMYLLFLVVKSLKYI